MVPTNDNSTGAAKLSGSNLVMIIKPHGGGTRVFAYDGDTPAPQIIKDLSGSTGWNLQPHSAKITQKITETKKSWYEGIKLGGSFSFPEGSLTFEVKPKKEVETIIEVEWRKPEPE